VLRLLEELVAILEVIVLHENCSDQSLIYVCENVGRQLDFGLAEDLLA
jgi:hypothetical protein